MSQLAKVFQCNWKGLNVTRAVVAAAVMVLLVVVLGLLHREAYWLSVTFAILFVGISDPGGQYGHRVRTMAFVGVVGALLTALAFSLGGGAWGLIAARRAAAAPLDAHRTGPDPASLAYSHAIPALQEEAAERIAGLVLAGG